MATSLGFSPNGRLLASTGSDRVILIWDASTGHILQSLTGHTDYVVQLLFIDDRTLLSRSYDATIRQWDLTTGGFEVINYLHRQWCMVMARSPDGNRVLFGSDTSMLTMLDRSTGSISSYPAVGSRVRTIAHTLDARYIVAITDDRQLNRWEPQDNYRHCHWSIGDRESLAIVAHPLNLDRLIIATEDGIISIWDLERQICLSRVVGHDREIRAIEIIHNPYQLVSCGIDGSIKLWEFVGDTLNEVYAIDFAKPYQDLNLTGVKGLNRSQLLTLKQLGAISN
jgi:WD40 repeat protein